MGKQDKIANWLVNTGSFPNAETNINQSNCQKWQIFEVHIKIYVLKRWTIWLHTKKI